MYQRFLFTDLRALEKLRDSSKVVKDFFEKIEEDQSLIEIQFEEAFFQDFHVMLSDAVGRV